MGGCGEGWRGEERAGELFEGCLRVGGGGVYVRDDYVRACFWELIRDSVLPGGGEDNYIPPCSLFHLSPLPFPPSLFIPYHQ